jgi:hypothetical protein
VGGLRRPVASSTTSATVDDVGTGSVVLRVSTETRGRVGTVCDEDDLSVRSVADRTAGRVTGDDDGVGDVALLVLLLPPLAVRRRRRPSSLDCGSRWVALVRGLVLVASSAWLAALRDLECGSRRAVVILVGGVEVVL